MFREIRRTKDGIIETRLAVSWRERRELISLRTDIYRKVGKHASESMMTDRWDEKSIIVGVYVAGVPVASARIIDCDPGDEWEHDRFISWDESWPDRKNCVEISRFCVHKDHRNWHVISALGTGLGYAMQRTRKRYAIACCTEDLMVFYREFFGVSFTGHQILHDDLGDKTHHMFSNDIESRMRGENIGFMRWCALWPPVLRQGIAGISAAGFIEKARLRAMLLVGVVLSPFVNKMIEAARYKRKRRL